MADVFLAFDLTYSLLLGVVLAMIVLSRRELEASRIPLLLGAILVMIRWSSWAFLTDVPWFPRSIIGALFGALLLGGLPALWQWANIRLGSQAEVAQSSGKPQGSPTQVEHSNPATQTAPSSASPPGELTVTAGSEETTTREPSYFLNILHSYNGIQAYDLMRPYFGKRMKVSGPVTVSQFNPNILSVAIGNVPNAVFCQFPPSSLRDLEGYNVGDTISVSGVISNANNTSNGMALVQCRVERF